MKTWISEEEYESMSQKEQEQLNYYLHGHCDEWVMQHFQKGDTILVNTYIDITDDKEHLCHCLLIRDGKFMDVRGETTDLYAAMEGFEDWWGGEEATEYEFTDLEAFQACIARIYENPEIERQ